MLKYTHQGKRTYNSAFYGENYCYKLQLWNIHLILKIKNSCKLYETARIILLISLRNNICEENFLKWNGTEIPTPQDKFKDKYSALEFTIKIIVNYKKPYGLIITEYMIVIHRPYKEALPEVPESKFERNKKCAGVDRAWCITLSIRRFVLTFIILTALSSTYHQHEPLVSLRSLYRVYTASAVVNKWGADTVSKWFRVGEKADRLFPDVGPFSLSSCRGGSSLFTA
ncbi:hypothetical protein AGLY_004595 [Aphis glycines]|uniref:Uncharacterized protein n=1 Tax=Aphis glycines TaxID=307491 RepID=A0A6G0TWQ1_APHGL|nr:hypothetical protein AGLY_004595 [Aphis glycines]